MLKKMVMINSGNFNFLDLNLETNLFISGDNGTGKTTVIRAIQYLFGGDSQKLGISRDKKSFKEFYFAYENSYIFYVFEEFFIFVYRTKNEIVKIFSKQKFDISEISDKNGKVLKRQDIMRYARKPTLKLTVSSNKEFRDVFYGTSRKYVDFSILKIQSSKTFIEIFNSIFNVDKAIIDSQGIKRSIQQSLDDTDRVLEFDYETYISKVNNFKNDVEFIKTFEKNRGKIEQSETLYKDLKISEASRRKLMSNIRFRQEFEKKKTIQIRENISHFETQVKKVKALENRLARRKTIFFKKVENHRINLQLEKKEIENLQNKFSDENVAKNRETFSKLKTLERDFNSSTTVLLKLKNDIGDLQKSFNDEIERLKHKRDILLKRDIEEVILDKTKLLRDELSQNLEKIEIDFTQFENLETANRENEERKRNKFDQD